MKLIVAIIQPSRLESVKAALTDVEVFRLTVMDVQGFGRQKGHTEVYRGHEFSVNLLRKVRLEIAVNDDFVEPTINAIIRTAVRPRTRPTNVVRSASTLRLSVIPETSSSPGSPATGSGCVPSAAHVRC